MEKTQTRETLSATTMIGNKVRNTRGEDLGNIEDFMIDLSDGCIAYAVLSFGGVLGVGDKLFAVPWDALSLNQREKIFILDVDKDRLKNAPGFDKKNWPDMADRTWQTEVYRFYGSSPRWER